MAFTHIQIQDELLSYLYQRFLAKDAPFDATIPFADIGIDSMTVVELVMYIEEKFKIEIPADQLTGKNLASLDALAACAIQHQTI